MILHPATRRWLTPYRLFIRQCEPKQLKDQKVKKAERRQLADAFISDVALELELRCRSADPRPAVDGPILIAHQAHDSMT
jgi:hypothetical protein